jgi:hypothetical protein
MAQRGWGKTQRRRDAKIAEKFPKREIFSALLSERIVQVREDFPVEKREPRITRISRIDFAVEALIRVIRVIRGPISWSPFFRVFREQPLRLRLRRSATSAPLRLCVFMIKFTPSDAADIEVKPL